KIEEGQFLSEKPYVKMDMPHLKEIGAKYLIVNYSTQVEPQKREEEKFLSENRDNLRLLSSFSPFFKKDLQEPKDPYSLTAAPDSVEDLFSRKSLGPYLEVYRIKNA